MLSSLFTIGRHFKCILPWQKLHFIWYEWLCTRLAHILHDAILWLSDFHWSHGEAKYKENIICMSDLVKSAKITTYNQKSTQQSKQKWHIEIHDKTHNKGKVCTDGDLTIMSHKLLLLLLSEFDECPKLWVADFISASIILCSVQAR